MLYDTVFVCTPCFNAEFIETNAGTLNIEILASFKTTQ